jgi:hypothetical protein
MMLISIDNLAHRYHCLPSEALERATTFDLYVLDVSSRYSKYRSEWKDGIPPAKMPTQDEMVDMLKRARQE